MALPMTEKERTEETAEKAEKCSPAPVEEVFQTLLKHFKTKPPSMDPFKVLISTILSQRTRDENTEVAANNLLAKYPTPEELAKADIKDVEKLIRPAGFYRAKAKSVVEVSRILVEKYGGEVPRDMETLLTLPSVGRKTANCVLVYGYDMDALPVDTHVHRISNRLCWVRTKTPDETEKALRDVIPRKYWKPINSLLIDFGRRVCLPSNPKCKICPIAHLCPSKKQSAANKKGEKSEKDRGGDVR